MGESQEQLEEFVYCAKGCNPSAHVSEVRKDGDHCVDKFNFLRRQVSPLQLGLCQNNKAFSAVVTVTSRHYIYNTAY